MKRRKDMIMEIALKKTKINDEERSKELSNIMKENVSPNASTIENSPNRTDTYHNNNSETETISPVCKVMDSPSIINSQADENLPFTGRNLQKEMELPATNRMDNSETNPSIIENTPDRDTSSIDDNFMIEMHCINPTENNCEEFQGEDDNESIKYVQELSRPSHERRVSCSSSSSSSSSSSNSSSSSSSTSSSKDNNNVTEAIQSNDTHADAGTNKSPRLGTSQEDRRNRANNVETYCISPINAPESDPDLSDDDPTFQSHNEALIRSRSSSSSDDSVQEISNHNESNTAQRQSRKRKRNPAGWKHNIVKMMRNTGQAYTSLSKSKKQISARSLKSPCTCRLKCPDNIGEIDRIKLFKAYWKLGNLEVQRSYISSCMMIVKPKYKYTNAQKPRSPNNAFFFTVNELKIRVCKKYFINTLDITERQIRTVKSKMNAEGFLEKDRRGKQGHKKKIDETVIQDIKNHINSIPRIESHYLRANTTREYIDGGKTIKDIWRDFSKIRSEQNKSLVDYWLYYDVFTTKFNIGFFQPKKDRCDLCMEYEMASTVLKAQLKEKYDDHLKEKILCRLEKLNDRKNIGKGNICVVYDLQAVMQCPVGDSSSFYYISKLNCLNFTMAELAKKLNDRNEQTVNENVEEDSSETPIAGAYGDVFNYFWDETQGKRGANEIGSCVLDYLRNVSEKYPDQTLNIIFYSDNCGGQNKNKFIACLYSYAVSQFANIESITHKFLIRGHTQNEGDNVHSLIEKEIKRNLKSGPIYTSHQYIALIKNAKKTGNPFKVQELSYNFFVDLKSLQDQWGYNFNEDDERKTMSWNDVKVLKCLKTDPFTFFFKTSFAQENFRRMNMRNKRKRMPRLEEVSIPKLFNEKIKLTENKRKGLKELLRKNLIPGFYTDYYKSLLNE